MFHTKTVYRCNAGTPAEAATADRIFRILLFNSGFSSEMDRKTGIKRLRIRGLFAVGYCARLKVIGIDIFRAARVKKGALDALKAPGSVFPDICSAFSAVKELFLRQWHRLSHIFHPAVRHQLRTAITAA